MIRLVGVTSRAAERALAGDLNGEERTAPPEDATPDRENVSFGHAGTRSRQQSSDDFRPPAGIFALEVRRLRHETGFSVRGAPASRRTSVPPLNRKLINFQLRYF